MSPGDSVKAEDTLITVESDKASMDVPSPRAGTVKAVSVSVGDKVSKGSLILTLDVGEVAETAVVEKAPTATEHGSRE